VRARGEDGRCFVTKNTSGADGQDKKKQKPVVSTSGEIGRPDLMQNRTDIKKKRKPAPPKKVLALRRGR